MSEITSRIKTLQNTSRTLKDLSKEPVPKGLPGNQQKEGENFNKWLEQASTKLKSLADKWEGEIKKPKSKGTETKQNDDMNKAFTLQYLELSDAMREEARKFEMVSNIMKKKHDTAKNAINNIR